VILLYGVCVIHVMKVVCCRLISSLGRLEHRLRSATAHFFFSAAVARGVPGLSTAASYVCACARGGVSSGAGRAKSPGVEGGVVYLRRGVMSTSMAIGLVVGT